MKNHRSFQRSPAEVATAAGQRLSPTQRALAGRRAVSIPKLSGAVTLAIPTTRAPSWVERAFEAYAGPSQFETLVDRVWTPVDVHRPEREPVRFRVAP